MVERAGRVRRVASCWVFVVLIGSLGLLAMIPFVAVAARLRRPSVWLLALAYIAGDVVLWTLPLVSPREANGDPVVWAGLTWFGLLFLIVAAGWGQLARLRQEILTGESGPPVAAIVRMGALYRSPLVHCALLSVDVEGSGDVLRDSEAFVRFRRVLFRILQDAFEASGIGWKFCARHDTGDGMIVVVPAKFPKSRLIYPLLERLAAGLRHHNRNAGAATRIRVRVAIHAGDVRIDDYGITGRPKVLLARLLDAGPLKTALAESPDTATVAAIVSDTFHNDVICHGHEGIDPGRYLPVLVRVKETDVRAWLHIPGHAPWPLAGRRDRAALNGSSDAEGFPAVP